MWEFTDRPVRSWWPLAAAVAGYGVVAAGIAAGRLGARPALPLLLAAGVALQFGFAGLEGRGLDAVRDRIVTTGHAEFARLAQDHDDIPALIADYDRLAAAGHLGAFGPAKPPGTLVFYVLTNRLGRLLHPGTDPARDLDNLRDTAARVWPFLAVLVALPLFWLARLTGAGSRAGLVAVALFFTVPAANLVTLHADQVIYPLFFVGCLAVGQRAGNRGSWGWGLAAGILASLTLGLSFGLAVVIFFLAAACLPSPRAGAGVAVGLAAALLLGWLVLHYDIVARFAAAVAYHQNWRPWPESLLAWPYFGGLNLLEFGVWLGAPLAVLWAARVAGGVGRRIPARELVLPATVLLLAFGARTQGETARLWLFLVPLVCLAVARGLDELGPVVGARLFLLTAALQLVTVLVIKANLDFC